MDKLVWVVLEYRGDYDSTIVRVYSTAKKAEAYCKANNSPNKSWEKYYTSEKWEVK